MAVRTLRSFQNFFSGTGSSFGITGRRSYAASATAVACLLGLLSCGFPAEVLANHPDDSCPDTHVEDGEAFEEGYVYHQTTFEKYPDGSAIPVGTPLRVSGKV